MKLIRTIAMLAICTAINLQVTAQEFCFPLIFEDAIGNLDTVFMGYDANATDSIDIEFGEENIVMQPWNNALDVRAGEVKDFLYFDTLAPSYQSKKQIAGKTCNFYHKLSILVKCDNYPLKISWDTTAFKSDSCRIGSHISSYPLFSWDVNYGEVWRFLSPDFFGYWTDSLIIENIGIGGAPFYYTDESNAIAMLFLTFSNPICVPWVGISEKDIHLKALIYPNPSSDYLNVQLTNCNFKEIRLLIYNVNNQLVLDQKKSLLSNSEIQLNTSTLDNGIYFIKILHGNETVAIKKWIKL